MKKLVILSALILSSMTVFSQESTLNNYTGAWTSGSSWSDGSAPAALGLPASNGNITMNGYINLGTAPAPAPGSGDILSFATNFDAYDFIVNDTLVVYGDVTFANKSMNLVINSGGYLIILGNLDVSNKITLASDGNLIVSGTFNKNGSQGTYTGTGNVYAGSYTGTASALVPDTSEKNAGTNLQADLPAVYDFVQNNGNTPLPVSLISFTAAVENNAVQLAWSTASEENNDYFTIERSTNGVDFEVLGTVNGAGNSNSTLTYNYTDNTPAKGKSYYRLSQTDFDGTTVSFEIVSVEFSTVKDLAVYPNPVNRGSELNIQTGADADEMINVMIYNHSGMLVKSEQLYGDSSVNLANDLETGFYVVKIQSGQVSKSTRLMIQ